MKPVPVTLPLMLTLALAVAPGVLAFVVRFVWARPRSAVKKGVNEPGHAAGAGKDMPCRIGRAANELLMV